MEVRHVEPSARRTAGHAGRSVENLPTPAQLPRTELCLRAIILAINSRELWTTGANGLDARTTRDQINGIEMDSPDAPGRS
jgi:hypothetical protein